MNKTFSNIFKRQHKNTKKNTDGHCLIDQASEIDQAYAIITRHMNAPRLNIETEVSPDVLNRLMKKVEETWSRLGQEDAHWSVITNEKFRKDSLSDHLDDFFASGEGDISRVEAALNRVGASLSEMNSIMDYGCGVGRLSIPLAKRCQHVLGVDISLAHLHEANANIERASLKNIDLSLAVSIGKLRELPEFDLVLSLIVLQHNSSGLNKARWFSGARICSFHEAFGRHSGANTALITARMRAQKRLRWARTFRILWPQAHRTAKMASPKMPLSGDLARRPSAFIWPISGSMALRRLSSFASTGVLPRRVPLISTRVVSTS